jgi:hypothetical protein
MDVRGRGAIVVVVALMALAACGGDDGGGSGTSSDATEPTTGDVTNDDGSVDECALLTDEEAAELMLVEPYAPGAPDNDACSWSTDPVDRELFAYVLLEVQPLEEVLDGRYPDYRTYLDESTTVGIEDLTGLGDEAFIVTPALSGIGIDVVDGEQVVSLSIQPAEPYDADSPEFERAVEIMQEVLDRL